MQLVLTMTFRDHKYTQTKLAPCNKIPHYPTNSLRETIGMRSSKQSHARGHRAKGKQLDNSKELEKYYSSVYGSRWPALREALLKPTVHAAVANGFIHSSSAAACSKASLLPLLNIGTLHVYRRPKYSGSYDPPPLDPTSALRIWYWLDLVSVLPVLVLQPCRGHIVLDMCAAPGGKSVLLAQRLFGQSNSAQPPSPAAVAPPAVPQASITFEPEILGSLPGMSESSRAEPSGGDAVAATGDIATNCHPAEDAVEAGQRQEEGQVGVSGADSPVGAAATLLPLQPLPLPLPMSLAPGKLVCNEPDRQRLQRLQRVLDEYLPLSTRGNVEVLNYQGHIYWGRNQATSYDRVLVDAPCSTDRHVLQQAEATQRGVIGAVNWSLAGCRRIADEQLQLCLAALRALRMGGRLVYSTCSIAPVQNDEVVERLLRRCEPGAIRVLSAMELLRGTLEEAVEVVEGQVVELLGVEVTQHGAICLPDRGGWGPLYMAVVEKTGDVAGMGAAALLRPQPTGGSEDEGDDDEEEEVMVDASEG